MNAAPADVALFPESVVALAHVIGWPATLSLIEAYPGQTLDLPKAFGALFWVQLESLIGSAATDRLLRTYAPGALYIPACKGLASAERNRQICAEVKALERTMATRRAVTQTAAKWRYTERTIWRILVPGNTTTTVAPTVQMLYQLPLL